MKNISRKVYFSKVRIVRMMTNEVEKDLGILKTEVFDRLINAYEVADENGDYASFQLPIDDDVIMLSNLHYVGDCICGMIGRGSKKINKFLCERNPNTFGTKELMPSEGSLFEFYTYFSISLTHLQVAFLQDSSIAKNIPMVILYILRKNLGSAIYDFCEDPLLEFDLKKKLKSMSGKIAVSGTLKDQRGSLHNALRSVESLENCIGTKFSVTINVKAKLNKRLSDADIDEISKRVTTDEGFSSFCFTDEQDSENEIVDVINKQAYQTKKIQIDREKLTPVSIWNQLCKSFLER